MVNGYAPKTLKEAFLILREEDAVPYAGGTDLMVENREGAKYLFLSGIPELREIRADDEYVRIGAAVTFSEAIGNELVPGLIREAAASVAAPAIRNMGTFGGNIGNASGKADTVTAEYAADAKVQIRSADGERIADIDKLYLGYRKLDLKKDELITEILIPKKGLDQYYYKKVGGRKALAISNVTFAGVYGEKNGRITKVSAAIGAVYGNVYRFRDLEERLTGKTPAEAKELKEDLLKAYEERMHLFKDRTGEAYRKTVSINLLSDFLTRFGI